MGTNLGHKQQFQPSELIGSWSITETLIDDDGDTNICTETYTFYKNGTLRWTQGTTGAEKVSFRYEYTVNENRIIASPVDCWIVEEKVFCITGDKLALYCGVLDETYILTKRDKKDE